MDFFRSLVDLAVRGGVFMIPLALVGLAAVVLIVERFLFLRENKVNWDRFHFELRSALKENNLEKGVVLAARTRGVIGRVMQECLLRVQAGETDVESATEKEILSEMAPMERSRGWLATIIQVAPLLGLIGTVQGMIVAFMLIERTATTDPKLLAGGIYTALITTFTGLLIAIPASLAQEHVRKETNKILHFLDLYLLEVREWLEKRGMHNEAKRELPHAPAAPAAPTAPEPEPASDGGPTPPVEPAAAPALVPALAAPAPAAARPREPAPPIPPPSTTRKPLSKGAAALAKYGSKPAGGKGGREQVHA